MPPSPDTFEHLGALYLGREVDPAAGELDDAPVLYDARDLTTHAVCVGMTGSGKTGLCVSLLEEAALDGIPALILDPKGDLTNLLLTFPQLRPADFAPWVDPAEAARQGLAPAEFAAQQAELWRDGLAQWGQTGERIERLRDAADFGIFTPGSEAGRGLSILSSFAAPGEAVRSDPDLFREQISAAATSLLGLLGIGADPLRSREHILLSQLIEATWAAGQDLDLPRLIQLIQSPPLKRVGALDLDAFFPADDRFELALALNNLLAAPAFAAWTHGEPLDVQSLLYGPQGRPRVSIVYLAHLTERERMFVVALLLNRMVAWMRTRSGTSSLRALLYMDEVFGYLPPVAEPPSKRPLLTLLKQARAYGLGVVLATQNPVDLDYKALSNIGTWFLGRLQTERDKLRVMEGLEGAAAGATESFDRAAMEQLLAGLDKRQFLLHNVHEQEPVVFHTRWAMSYLRGPLTRDQVARLEPPRPAAAAPAPPPVAATTAPAPPPPSPDATAAPLLPPEIPQAFVAPRLPATGAALTYRPHVAVIANVHFVDSRRNLAAEERLAALAPLTDSAAGVDWDAARRLDLSDSELRSEAPAAGAFADLPGAATKKRSYASWRKRFEDWAYRERRYPLFRCDSLDEFSRPGETEAEFRIRLAEAARAARDVEIGKLRTKYASKFDSLRERIRKAEQAVDREREQAQDATVQTAISLGSTLLSALLGRSAVGRAGTTARGAGYAMRQRQDIARARENVAEFRARLEDMEAELEADVEEVRARYDPTRLPVETFELKPRRTDIDVLTITLAWVPYEHGPDGRPVALI